MVSTMAQAIQAARPHIEIKLKKESEAGYSVLSDGKPWFTTLEQIEGEVTFIAPTETRFDEIYIGFEGRFPR